MIILLLLVAIAILVVGIFLDWECTSTVKNAFGFVMKVVGITATVVLIICLVVNCCDICYGVTAEDKIVMYENENANIEEQVVAVIEQYQQYELGVIESVKVDNKSAMTLVTLYPELKSDRLVQSLIDIYVENNNKIKELKEQVIAGQFARWLVYFGS